MRIPTRREKANAAARAISPHFSEFDLHRYLPPFDDTPAFTVMEVLDREAAQEFMRILAGGE